VRNELLTLLNSALLSSYGDILAGGLLSPLLLIDNSCLAEKDYIPVNFLGEN